MILFYGDSITSGENNDFVSYVQKLGLRDYYENYAISGTTIGDYSLYPVKHNNLLELLYKDEEQIKCADKIFLSYGANDISSVALGYVKIEDVMINLNKCLDFIQQVNPDCEISYIFLSDNKKIISDLGKLQASYLSNYLGFDFNEKKFVKVWTKCWLKFYLYVDFHFRISEFYSMINELDFFQNYIDSDHLHPNDKGYEKIAENLIQQYILI